MLLLIVAGGCFVLVYGIMRSHIERGQFSVSDTYVSDNPARSLDLKVAAKATYPSSPLTLSEDLGMVDGLRDQIFKFPVKDEGLTEYGLMMTPAAPPPPHGYPVIILLHGFSKPSRYSTTSAYLGDMEFYAHHGFLVVKPDLRGHGDSIDQGFPDSAYYSMSYNIDVLSLISALRQTPKIDKSQINIWGHSMGSYLALRAAVLSPYIRDIVILSSPADSLQEMYLSYIPPSDENNPYALSTRTEVFAKYGTPAEDKAFWYDASPINFVGRIKGVVQIHVGLNDGVVPPFFSADLDQALSKAKVKHQYYAYPGGDHSLSAERTEIYSRSLQILQPPPTAD